MAKATSGSTSETLDREKQAAASYLPERLRTIASILSTGGKAKPARATISKLLSPGPGLVSELHTLYTAAVKVKNEDAEDIAARMRALSGLLVRLHREGDCIPSADVRALAADIAGAADWLESLAGADDQDGGKAIKKPKGRRGRKSNHDKDEAIRRRYVEGRETQEDIAFSLGMTAGAVSKAIKRAEKQRELKAANKK